MPGVFAGLVGAAAALWPSVSSAEQVILFPATAPIANSTQFGRLKVLHFWILKNLINILFKLIKNIIYIKILIKKKIVSGE